MAERGGVILEGIHCFRELVLFEGRHLTSGLKGLWHAAYPTDSPLPSSSSSSSSLPSSPPSAASAAPAPRASAVVPLSQLLVGGTTAADASKAALVVCLDDDDVAWLANRDYSLRAGNNHQKPVLPAVVEAPPSHATSSPAAALS